MSLGIQNIKRETFDSSAYFVKDLLVDMGFEEGKAVRLIEKFRIHDDLMIKKQFVARGDDKSLLSISQQGVAQLAQVLRDESMQSNISVRNK